MSGCVPRGPFFPPPTGLTPRACPLSPACSSLPATQLPGKIFIILLPALLRLSLPVRCQNDGIIRGKPCLSPGMVADS